MQIAIPVKTNKENPAIAPLFGKAKWFAFIEDGKIEIITNPCKGGTEVAKWLIDEKVDAILFAEMGDGPYEILKSMPQIKLYHTGFERITLEEALLAYNEQKLVLADSIVMEKVIAQHESKHSHGHHHGHHHHC